MFEIDYLIGEISTFISDKTHIISIIIGESSQNQLHCGIAFKDENIFNAIHLAWHYDLRFETNIEGTLKEYYWVKSKIHLIRQNSISAICRRIKYRKDTLKIPYGLIYENGKFTEDGILILDKNEHGLTCATFVLAIFNSCGIRLIDTNNWKHRDDDNIRHSYLLNMLIQTKDKYNISDNHIENIKNEIGCVRFRPEEVADKFIFSKSTSFF